MTNADYTQLEETKDSVCPFCHDEHSHFVEELPDSALDEYFCFVECSCYGARSPVAATRAEAVAYWLNRGGKEVFEQFERPAEDFPEFIAELDESEKSFLRFLRIENKNND